MCYISLLGATVGGIVPRKVYYNLQVLNLDDGNGPKYILKDKSGNVTKNIDTETYETIMRHIIDELNKIPSSGDGRDPAYKGLEIIVKCHGFEWSNRGPSGCIHYGSDIKPTSSQQKIYDDIVKYLTNLRI